MKEQLANMTIIELVRTAHSYATSIQQIDTHSAIVREMASRLEALNLAHIGGMNSLRSAISDRDQLAAENAALKAVFKQEVIPDEAVNALMDTALIDHDWNDTGEWSWVENETDVIRAVLDALVTPETPATDAWQREQMAQAHKEGAYFVANRMLAAWEAGFIEDTAKNAADIARMILTSTEFMADAPEGDFERSFADGVLEDIAAQLRNGEAS